MASTTESKASLQKAMDSAVDYGLYTSLK